MNEQVLQHNAATTTVHRALTRHDSKKISGQIAGARGKMGSLGEDNPSNPFQRSFSTRITPLPAGNSAVKTYGCRGYNITGTIRNTNDLRHNPNAGCTVCLLCAPSCKSRPRMYLSAAESRAPAPRTCRETRAGTQAKPQTIAEPAANIVNSP